MKIQIRYVVEFVPNPDNGDGIAMESFFDLDFAIRYRNERMTLYPNHHFQIVKVEINSVKIVG